MFKFIVIIFSIVLSNQTSFDSNKAYDFVLKQCSFGPRYPGSNGHKDCKDYLINQVKSYSDSIIIDEHTILDPLVSDSVKIYNIFGQINPENKKRILSSLSTGPKRT